MESHWKKVVDYNTEASAQQLINAAQAAAAAAVQAVAPAIAEAQGSTGTTVRPKFPPSPPIVGEDELKKASRAPTPGTPEVKPKKEENALTPKTRRLIAAELNHQVDVSKNALLSDAKKVIVEKAKDNMKIGKAMTESIERGGGKALLFRVALMLLCDRLVCPPVGGRRR